MSTDDEPSFSSPGVERRLFVPVVVGTEVVLGLVALGIGCWVGIDWHSMLRPTASGALLGVLSGLGVTVIHLVLLFPGRQRNPLYRTIYVPLYHTLRPELANSSAGPIFLLAVSSGVAEELFFRGWLQTEVGIILASTLFGAAHVWNREALPYGLYATGMGFVLGGLFLYTEQGLWAPILAHGINNLIGLLALAYNWVPEPSF